MTLEEIKAALDAEDYASLSPQEQVNHKTLEALLAFEDVIRLMRLDILALRERIGNLEYQADLQKVQEAKGGTDAATT